MPILELISAPDRRKTSRLRLSPAQRTAAEGVMLGLERGNFAVVQDFGSGGKTTIVNYVHDQLGGARIGVREFVSRLAGDDPWKIEEAFLQLLEDHLEAHDLLLVDDLHLVQDIAEGCDYPRKGLFDAVIAAVLAQAAAACKKILFATSEIPAQLQRRAHCWAIADFESADFECICSAYLDPAAVRRLDFEEIHRFAPSLNAHQLQKAAVWLAHEPGLDTARFLEYLNKHDLVSNVEIDEVEAVTWNDLKGVDEVIQALEAKIALPFENRELAAELKLKPKRGVLLAGPPGTGKTTIGRALAHRLKGKFFLIDGTMIAGTGRFYSEIDRVFNAAKRNAPSIVFIDDADVIFSGDRESGLYRYLLTKLDGLEGASAGRVCVMMTAMEPSDLPAAILRSGRIELWLETRLPDQAARAQIFRENLEPLPLPWCAANIDRLAPASRGLTGADLKAVIEDGKLQFAYDRSSAKPARAVESYLLEAIAAIRRNRRKYRKRKPVQLGEPPMYGFTADSIDPATH